MEVYDKIFDWYCRARSAEAGVEIIRSFSKRLTPGSEVLDIGCGFGVPITSTLAELGLRPRGIDSSKKMVARFREELPEVPIECADVLTADFFNTTFDAVIGYGFMFHLAQDQQRAVIEKGSGALRPGGYFLFNSGDEDASKMTVPEHNGGEVFMTYSMSAKNYSATLEQHGMVLVEHRIEERFGSDIYVAKKSLDRLLMSVNPSGYNTYAK